MKHLSVTTVHHQAEQRLTFNFQAFYALGSESHAKLAMAHRRWCTTGCPGRLWPLRDGQYLTQSKHSPKKWWKTGLFILLILSCWVEANLSPCRASDVRTSDQVVPSVVCDTVNSMPRGVWNTWNTRNTWYFHANYWIWTNRMTERSLAYTWRKERGMLAQWNNETEEKLAKQCHV